jgi:hypothetical protein
VPKLTNRELVWQVVTLARELRAGPRPTGPEDSRLDALAVLVERGLARRSFPDDLVRELRRVGLHVHPRALAEALTQPTLH